MNTNTRYKILMLLFLQSIAPHHKIENISSVRKRRLYKIVCLEGNLSKENIFVWIFFEK